MTALRRLVARLHAAWAAFREPARFPSFVGSFRSCQVNGEDYVAVKLLDDLAAHFRVRSGMASDEGAYAYRCVVTLIEDAAKQARTVPK